MGSRRTGDVVRKRPADTERGGGAALPTVAEIAAELWNADHDDGKARYGITLNTHSADPFAPDNREAWDGYKDNARRIRRLFVKAARPKGEAT